MKITIKPAKDIVLEKESLVALSKQKLNLIPSLQIQKSDADIKVGSFLQHNQETLFQVTSIATLENDEKIFFLKALKDINLKEQSFDFTIIKRGFSVGIITLSDKASKGLRVDESGKIIEELVSKNLNTHYVKKIIIPDESAEIKRVLSQAIFNDKLDLIITTGGTGVTERDITPEVTLPFVEKRLYGFEHIMMQTALAKTPYAIISRAVAGIANETLIINLPGSPKAVRENLEPVLPAITHAIEKMQGDKTDCAKPL